MKKNNKVIQTIHTIEDFISGICIGLLLYHFLLT
jgi:F0F1-type ATP synthase assembly protein I